MHSIFEVIEHGKNTTAAVKAVRLLGILGNIVKIIPILSNTQANIASRVSCIMLFEHYAKENANYRSYNFLLLAIRKNFENSRDPYSGTLNLS